MRAIPAALVLLLTICAEARQHTASAPEVTISSGSARVDGIELRTGPKLGALRFFSLKAAEDALGAPEDTYVPRGVRVYAWRSVGTHLQRGWRSAERDKLFKLQVFLVGDYDARVEKHTGTFRGTVRVDGVKITRDTSLDNIRAELEGKGYQIGEDTAKKGEITILCAGPNRTVTRIEQWCD